MPILGALFTTLLSGLASFFTLFVSKKIAFGVAAAAMFTTLTAALFLVMRTTVLALAGSGSLTGAAASFVGALMPPVASACVSAYVTTWTGCMLYKWKAKALDIFVKA